jgi:hypothetical protein
MGNEYTDKSAGELRCYVVESVPTVDPIKIEISERNGWIEVRAGTSTERRTNDQKCGDGYGNAHEERLNGAREC